MEAYFSLAPYYDKLTSDVDYQAFALFYEKVFGLYGERVQTVLDLACGTGTLTGILAKLGYEMIGTDGSPEMLSVAQEKLSGEEYADCIRPLLLNQAMEETDLYGTVDAAVCSLDGINYVLPENLDEVFRRMKLFIRPGGVFVFDINTLNKLRGLDGQVFLDERDDVYCVWRTEYDFDSESCFYGMDIFTRDGEMWHKNCEEHIEYGYRPVDLKKKLENNGFGEIRIFGELEMRAPRPDEQRIFISARRM